MKSTPTFVSLKDKFSFPIRRLRPQTRSRHATAHLLRRAPVAAVGRNREMGSLQNALLVQRTSFFGCPLPSSASCQCQGAGTLPRRTRVGFRVGAEKTEEESIHQQQQQQQQDKFGRRHILAFGAIATIASSLYTESTSVAAETKKGFQPVLDQKDGYKFYYPFGWQEIVIQGQDKVFKDVIEPLESVSVNMIPTNKKDIRDLGSPQEVAETLIQKVLAPSTQKTKLVDAAEHDVNGQTYYTFEFVAKAPNFTRHALGTITIGNGKFYTLTTGANERRWDKVKDKLHTVVDSFKVFNV